MRPAAGAREQACLAAVDDPCGAERSATLPKLPALPYLTTCGAAPIVCDASNPPSREHPMTTFTQAPTTTYTLQVFHNTYSDAEGRGAFSFAPFDPTHPIVHVADLTVEANSIEGAMNRAYHLLNVGDDPEFGTPEPQAVAYRARRNRSLSVHDVLVFDGVAFAVADCCFARVTIDPAAVSTTSVYGSTYLP